MVLQINHQQKSIGDSSLEIKLVRKLLKKILNKKGREREKGFSCHY
jgi:hypothetical protein